MMDKILVVDDEKDTRDFMARALSGKYDVATAADAELAMKMLEADKSYRLLLSDVRMPGEDGITLMKAAKAANPNLAVVLLTAFGSIDQAVEAMKDGADDFITKPVDLDQLELRVEKALKAHRLEEQVEDLKAQLDEKYGLDGIVGNSPAMQKVFRMVKQAAPTDATVLLEGPSGTGKELVARAIHNLSPRAKGPFVAVEFAAISPNLLESELFGHERGAFTGAVARRAGRFEAANHGTIFLDEISEMPLELQVKLLRVLQEREFQRVGSNETIKTDIRIVAATNRDLAAYVRAGKFREDLYYRLNVIDLHLPALKDRVGDIPLLVGRFMKEFGGKSVSPEAMKILETYPWPGNVRELRNTVEKMCVLSPSGEIGEDDVPDEMKRGGARTLSTSGTLEETEKEKILAVLDEVGGNRTKAAERLGISRRTIYRKLEEYGHHVLSVLVMCAMLVAGCATWTFTPTRSARFVSENGEYLHVDYGREEHESTFVAPSGVTLPFKTKLKVRVTAPDGRRFVAWQVMSPRGVLYKTDNEHWEYYEEGTGCILAERADDGVGYELRFQGVLCANLKPEKKSNSRDR